MSEHHHHHHEHQQITSLNTAYVIAMVLNLCFVVFETKMGHEHESMGLFADALHKFMDVFTLIIALIGFKLAAKNPRASAGLSIANCLILMAAIIVVLVGSAQKIAQPSTPDGHIISITAAVGIVVSGISALLLMKHRGEDLNTRAAFLHMATDSLLSLGVVISGLLIAWTGWVLIDPIVSIAISGVLFANTLDVLKESYRKFKSSMK